MKTWRQISDGYYQYLVDIELKQPNRRKSSLIKIENSIQANYPDWLNSDYVFMHFSKEKLKEMYAIWKGKKINKGEEQVINDFYKLSL